MTCAPTIDIGQIGDLLRIFAILKELSDVGPEHCDEAMRWARLALRENPDIDWWASANEGGLKGIASDVAGLTGCDVRLCHQAAKASLLQTRAKVVLAELRRYKSAHLNGCGKAPQ